MFSTGLLKFLQVRCVANHPFLFYLADLKYDAIPLLAGRFVDRSTR